MESPGFSFEISRPQPAETTPKSMAHLKQHRRRRGNPGLSGVREGPGAHEPRIQMLRTTCSTESAATQ